jgi:OmpA family
VATDEQAWWAAHPDPQVTQNSDRLVLWNYPIARTELADSHKASIQSFLSMFILAPELNGSRISVCGHASPTGEASANVAIASGRAQNVATFLTGLGYKGFEVTSAGSAQPADTAPSGQAMARNRRVEMTKSGTGDITPVRVPVEAVPEQATAPAPAAKPSGVGLTFEYEAEFPIDTVSTPAVEGSLTAVVKGKGKVVRGGDASFAEGLSVKGSAATAKFEKRLADHLKGKITLDPGGSGRGPSVKLGMATDAFGPPAEFGFQPSNKFFFFKLTLGTLDLPKLDLDNAVVALQFSLELKMELGVSKQALVRLGVSAGSAGAVAAGVIAVAAVIIGGTIYATEEAKTRMLAVVADVAERDGAASQVAYECLGATERVAVAVRDHRLELTKAGGLSSQANFESGRKIVSALLQPLKDDARAATVSRWQAAFAKDSNELDFDNVRRRVLEKLAPYQDDPPPLAPLIADL